MTHSLDAFDSLFWDDVREALHEMPDDDWDEMCYDIFDCPINITVDDIIDEIEETDIYLDLADGTIEVWIDPEGKFTVKV